MITNVRKEDGRGLSRDENLKRTLRTIVPMTPKVFASRARQKHFTTKQKDCDMVIGLYNKAWPTIREKSTPFWALAWEDEELQEFLDVLPELPYIREVYFNTCKFSDALMDKLYAALKARGGFATVV